MEQVKDEEKIRLQEAARKLAGRLSTHLLHSGCARRVCYYVIFFLLFGGACLLVLIEGLRPAKPAEVSFDRMVLPQPVPELSDSIDLELYRRLTNDIRYLDSLKADSAGRLLYDTLLRYNPGLLDSLRFYQQYFSPDKQ